MTERQDSRGTWGKPLRAVSGPKKGHFLPCQWLSVTSGWPPALMRWRQDFLRGPAAPGTPDLAGPRLHVRLSRPSFLCDPSPSERFSVSSAALARVQGFQSRGDARFLGPRS